MSRVFADAHTYEGAKERLEALTGVALSDSFESLFADAAEPERALTNLERWLRATASPALHLHQLIQIPKLSSLLMMILGGSQPLADSLIQNPELATILLDPQEVSRVPSRDEIEQEGRRLIQHATSYTHALDRLRFLKQRWTLSIVINDLARLWPEDKVWLALSDLADALIALVLEVAWREQAPKFEMAGECPMLVVAFGKLGGQELNYSSDIDLVYALPDGLDEKTEGLFTRFAESVNRALSDRMGRGALYRVDLRLRPYGGAGPLVRSMRSVEAYYRLYAEPWEVQALLRSAPVAGPEELKVRWEEMRRQMCFRPQLSEPELEHMLHMRTRIEERADANDLKRGAGGIRDVEFLVQVLQMIHGSRHPALQTRPTLEALSALDKEGKLEHAVTKSLAEGYVFLRQLEHRCQLVGDQQTHSIPEDSEGRERIARLMGAADWSELSGELERHRRTIQTLYRTTIHPNPELTPERQRIADALGPHAGAAMQWLDGLPEADAFYAVLSENEGSLRRMESILSDAPRLVAGFRSSLTLTEQLFSGEIEEEGNYADRIERLSIETPLKTVAEAYVSAWTAAVARWTLTRDGELGPVLSSIMDALVRHIAKRLYATFDIVALGSYGNFELGVASDADLVLLVPASEKHAEAEQQAQGFLSVIGQLRRYGAPVSVDLRLRPEGGKGLLVRSYEGFAAYELEDMEMWERFALGHARLVHGSEETLKLVLKAAYAQPLTPERLQELMAMKRRVETERVMPHNVRRDVKLGWGGLNDIEWLVHLHEMRYPGAIKAGRFHRMDDRIRSLAQAQLINAIDEEQLLHARTHLLEVRARIALLGIEGDIIPENPDKLDRLARSFGDADGNEFLARHERIIDTVRAIYQQGLERLKA